MQVELLIELECAIVVLPILREKAEQPLLGQLGAAVFSLLVFTLVAALGERGAGSRFGVVLALTGRASLS